MALLAIGVVVNIGGKKVCAEREFRKHLSKSLDASEKYLSLVTSLIFLTISYDSVLKLEDGEAREREMH